jgi:hypothetical protein
VTLRKPPGLRFETWIDRQIREGIDQGAFDNLAGAGKPIPGIGEVHDDAWWVKQKLRREQVSVLPPTLALRKEAEDARRAAALARSEDEARAIIDAINRKIRRAFAQPLAGPPLNLVPFDVERVAERWRAEHPGPVPDARPLADAPAPARRSWWGRGTRRSRRPATGAGQ